MNEELIRLLDESVEKANAADDALRAGAPVDAPEIQAAVAAVHAVNEYIDEHGIEGEDGELIPMQIPVAFTRVVFRRLLIAAALCALVLAGLIYALVSWIA